MYSNVFLSILYLHEQTWVFKDSYITSNYCLLWCKVEYFVLQKLELCEHMKTIHPGIMTIMLAFTIAPRVSSHNLDRAGELQGMSEVRWKFTHYEDQNDIGILSWLKECWYSEHLKRFTHIRTKTSGTDSTFFEENSSWMSLNFSISTSNRIYDDMIETYLWAHLTTVV